MIDIPFSYNWNNKLDCKAFTTIRLYNPNKHIAGTRVRVLLNGNTKGLGEMKAIKPFMLKDLNEYISYLDTGYNVEECTKVLKTMYKEVDFEKQKLVLILIVKD